MRFTRLSASVLLAAVLAAGGALQPARADTPDQERILTNYTELFAGNEQVNAHPEVAHKLQSIESLAGTRIGTLLPRDQWDGAQAIFSHLPLGTAEANITATFGHLVDIALETRTPGTSGFGDTARQGEVVTALRWMSENHFSGEGGYYGNWYQWEIGAPTQATKALVLVREQAATDDPGLINDLVASMDAYLRAGSIVGDVDLKSRFHTGANLADITTNRIIQGALLKSDGRIAKAITDQLTVFATIDPRNLVNDVTDGYYRDGSFIQHASVAYTGSYGKVLLTRVMQSIKVLDGTNYLESNSLSSTVLTWIRDGFAPIIDEGYVMEIVKGRGVSRQTTGYTDVVSIVEAMTDLTRYLDDTRSAELSSYVKHVAASSKSAIPARNFVSPASILEFANIMSDDSIDVVNPYRGDGHFTFNAMENDVHLSEGFAFAIARSSERISKYEYMSGENLQAWFQGDGAYYLYLSGQDQNDAYGADYYTVVDPMRLAGVTAPVEIRKTIPELYDGKLFYDNEAAGFTPSSVLQNEYVYFPLGTNQHSGGARLDGYGLSSLTLSPEVGWADKQAGKLPPDFEAYPNAEGSKSFFMLGDFVVVLGAGIRDEHGRELVSTVDSRVAGPHDGAVVHWIAKDGSTGSGATTDDLTNVLWHNPGTGASVGYAFLDDNAVSVSTQEVTRDRQVVRTKNTGTVTKNVVWVGYEHGVAPLTRIAYAIVPNATVEDLPSATSSVEIVANSGTVQAVRDREQGILLATFFEAADIAAMSSDGPASAILRESGDGWHMAVSDPTFSRGSIRLDVAVPGLELADAVSGVAVEGGESSSVITVDTRDAFGKVFEFELVKSGPTPTTEPSATPTPTATTTATPSATVGPSVTAPPSATPGPTAAPTSGQTGNTIPTPAPGTTQHTRRPGLPSSGN